MAKLTLSFKDRKLKVFALQSDECLIGRDAGCCIAIDSLAVEPRHAIVRAENENHRIEPVSDAEVLVNDERISEPHPLSEGDRIQVGKHTLVFADQEEGTVLDPGFTRLPSVGWLQIQSGSHLGRTIRLDKAFTRIGKPDGHLAVIARRDEGYFVSHLQGDRTPTVNDQDIADSSHKLADGDQVCVNELRVQFFSDSETTGQRPEQTQQRQFSRIPFDVAVTLQSDRQSFETKLVDISLHGALVKAPASFEVTEV